MNKEETVAELLPQIYQHINETVSNAIKSALEQVKNRNVPKLSPGNEDF
jgi:hypothetical protein